MESGTTTVDRSIPLAVIEGGLAMSEVQLIEQLFGAPVFGSIPKFEERALVEDWSDRPRAGLRGAIARAMRRLLR